MTATIDDIKRRVRLGWTEGLAGAALLTMVVIVGLPYLLSFTSHKLEPIRWLPALNAIATAFSVTAYILSGFLKDRRAAVSTLAILGGGGMVSCGGIALSTGSAAAFGESLLWAILFALLLGGTIIEAGSGGDSTGTILAFGIIMGFCGFEANWPAGWTIGSLLIATDLPAFPDIGGYRSWMEPRNPGIWNYFASLILVAVVSAGNIFLWTWTWVFPTGLLLAAAMVQLRKTLTASRGH